MPIQIHEHARTVRSDTDGTRMLVTRYWPRGLQKRAIDTWEREIAPSGALLSWYRQRTGALNRGSKEDVAWSEFAARYKQEVLSHHEKLVDLARRVRNGETISLLCACVNSDRCHRSVLAQLIGEHVATERRISVGYVRVSGIRQAQEGLGLETQERRIYAWAEAQGIVPARIIRDEAQSGATRDRPGFRLLCDLLRGGTTERVIVYKLDRLSRSLLDIKQFAEAVLVPNEASLVSVTEQIDTASTSGKLFFNILGSFAEFERDLITERLRAARESKVLRGIKGAGRVYGYRWKGRGRERALVPVAREIEAVKRIFAEFIKTPCLNALTYTIRSLGFRTRAGKPFSRSTLRYILQNSFYCGTVHHNSMQVRGCHIAAVPIELFTTAQTHLGELRRRKRQSLYPRSPTCT